MQDLHVQLTGTGIVALNQAAAIAGLGGIGKTQTAVEYAYRCFQDERIYEWVFWVKADTELNLATDFAAIARSLDLGDGTIDVLAARSRQWLETHDRWLLIFDNADEPKWLKPFFPKNASGKILLTSRSPRLTVLGISQPITVTAWDEVDSIKFLCERTGQELDQLNADESKAVKALAQEFRANAHVSL